MKDVFSVYVFTNVVKINYNLGLVGQNFVQRGTSTKNKIKAITLKIQIYEFHINFAL